MHFFCMNLVGRALLDRTLITKVSKISDDFTALERGYGLKFRVTALFFMPSTMA